MAEVVSALNVSFRHTRLLPLIVPAGTVAQALPFSQNWTNAGLITTDDDWSHVPGITGYLGDYLPSSAPTAVDPRTLVQDFPTVAVDVIANQTAPNSLTTGGVAEFEATTTNPNPTIALNGSGTADAPFILINISTLGQTAITVAYNVRDIDGSSDNAVQQVALHYRVGSSGNFTNVPAAYVADATTANSATQSTAISVVLPASVENQPLVQLRIMTTNAVGNDEWVGIDDISITGSSVPTPTPPTGVGSANPGTLFAGASTDLTVQVTPGSSAAVTDTAGRSSISRASPMIPDPEQPITVAAGTLASRGAISRAIGGDANTIARSSRSSRSCTDATASSSAARPEPWSEIAEAHRMAPTCHRPPRHAMTFPTHAATRRSRVVRARATDVTRRR